jgi:hypothetical protein
LTLVIFACRRIELSSKSALISKVASKYFTSIRIELGRCADRKSAKYILALPSVQRIQLNNAQVLEKVWKRTIPSLLSNLEAIELSNSGIYHSFVDFLRLRGAANSLKSISINYGKVTEETLQKLAHAAYFSSLRVLKINTRFAPSPSALSSVMSTFTQLADLSMPMESIQTSSFLKNLQFLSRLSVSCRCNSPTFRLFQIPALSEYKRDWSATARLMVDKMASCLPSNLKPWNFFLRQGHFEYNLLTRAVWLRSKPFVNALLREYPHWNLDAACSRSNRTALLWCFLAHLRNHNQDAIDYATPLLNLGANPIVVDGITGLSPLHFAIYTQSLELFHLILTKATERDPNAPYYIAGPLENGFTALGVAYALRRDLKTPKMLFDAFENGMIKDLFFNSLTRIKYRSKRRSPILHVLVQSYESTVWLPLLDTYKDMIDINVRDSSGSSFLHVPGVRMTTEAIEILLPRSNLTIDDVNNEKLTAIDCAIRWGNLNLFLAVGRLGANIDIAIANCPPFAWASDMLLDQLSKHVEASETAFPFTRTLFERLAKFPAQSGPIIRVAAALHRHKQIPPDTNMFYEAIKYQPRGPFLMEFLKAPKFNQLVKIDDPMPVSVMQKALEYNRVDLSLFEDHVSILELAAVSYEAPTALLVVLERGANVLAVHNRSHGLSSLEILYNLFKQHIVSTISMETLLADSATRHPSSAIVQKLKKSLTESAK